MIKYPGAWKLGKPRGSIKEFPAGYHIMISPPNQKQLSYYIYFKDYDSKEKTLKAAEKFRQNESDNKNLTRNSIRYIDKDTIEVKLQINDDVKIMKTDANLLDKVQKYPLNLKAKKNNNNGITYYVRSQDGKRNFPFTNLICDYKIVDYINNDTLDLRINNLTDRCKIKKPKKIKRKIIVDEDNELTFLCNQCNSDKPRIECCKLVCDKIICSSCQLKNHNNSSQNYEKEKKEKEIEYRKKYFNEYKKIIEEKGGKVISSVNEYQTAHSKLKVQCTDKHLFAITLNNAQRGKWCPHCLIYIGELISKCFLQHIFEKPFIKIRPIWLRTENNTLLELDAYNEELKLACEYNGIQHYKYIEYFHKSEEKFKKQKERDQVKLKLCKENEVDLIVIPFDIVNENILPYIVKELKDIGYDVDDEKIKSFKMNSIYKTRSRTEEIKNLIESKGGKLIDGSYLSGASFITIECEKGHQWTTRISCIKNNSWCHQCGIEVDEDTKVKISESLKKFNKTKEGIVKQTKSHQKRSETMKIQREELRKNITEKICKGPLCLGKVLPKENFANKTQAADGLQTNCRKCVMVLKTEWKEKQKLKN